MLATNEPMNYHKIMAKEIKSDPIKEYYRKLGKKSARARHRKIIEKAKSLQEKIRF